MQLYKSLNLRSRQGAVLINLASIYHELGRSPEAIASAAEANRIFVELKNRRFELATLSALGRLYFDSGNQEKRIAVLS